MNERRIKFIQSRKYDFKELNEIIKLAPDPTQYRHVKPACMGLYETAIFLKMRRYG